jgi:hypothetical protein
MEPSLWSTGLAYSYLYRMLGTHTYALPILPLCLNHTSTVGLPGTVRSLLGDASSLSTPAHLSRYWGLRCYWGPPQSIAQLLSILGFAVTVGIIIDDAATTTVDGARRPSPLLRCLLWEHGEQLLDYRPD